MKRNLLRDAAIGLAAFSMTGAVTGASAEAPVKTETLASGLSLADEVAIHDLYARFAYAVDGGKGQDFANTWTDDGEFTGGRGPGKAHEVRKPIKGRTALLAMGDSQGLGTRHFYANIVLTKTPQGVEGHAYMLLLMSRSSPPTIIETAIYDDVIVKTPQGWRFKKRTVWRDDDDITPYKFKPMPGSMPGAEEPPPSPK